MTEYEATWDSLDRHETPAWFRDAKLGIFIHWGIYSVPGWAPGEEGHDPDLSSDYAEWYPNYMYEEGSPFREYHLEHYGADVEYIDFLEDWQAERWDPDRWADRFEDVGAGYVVMVGEHHDGFPLWDSHYQRYNTADMGPERDLVGELGEAVRERDLKYAVSNHGNLNYYQPGFEGQYGHPAVEDEDTPPGPEYVHFMNAKLYEIVRKYDTDMLWFDLPKARSDDLHVKELIADFYNRAAERGKEVAVNDRSSLDAVGTVIDTGDDEWHGDFETPEYAVFDEVRDTVWESVRGIGRSFGYNRAEDDADHIARDELIHSFVDIVSKNGNLLLNVGPRADGTIPEPQLDRLRALGDWLDVNGDAIFGTRPWAVAEDRVAETELRYTWREGTLYVTLLEYPESGTVTTSIPAHVTLSGTADGHLLTAAGERAVGVDVGRGTVTLDLGERPDHEYAWSVALADVPNPRQSGGADADSLFSG
ncbi:MAG: alpha-L-fucosidase [Halobacteriaceae archaeon]